MSTWHQRKATHARYLAGEDTYLGHPTLWTILNDPPNEMRSSTTFESEAAARTALDIWRRMGKQHLLLLPPKIKRV